MTGAGWGGAEGALDLVSEAFLELPSPTAQIKSQGQSHRVTHRFKSRTLNPILLFYFLET